MHGRWDGIHKCLSTRLPWFQSRLPRSRASKVPLRSVLLLLAQRRRITGLSLVVVGGFAAASTWLSRRASGSLPIHRPVEEHSKQHHGGWWWWWAKCRQKPCRPTKTQRVDCGHHNRSNVNQIISFHLSPLDRVAPARPGPSGSALALLRSHFRPKV
jgi:hypothetical protein